MKHILDYTTVTSMYLLHVIVADVKCFIYFTVSSQ